MSRVKHWIQHDLFEDMLICLEEMPEEAEENLPEEFKYNEHGVCLNPHVYKTKERKVEVAVMTAQLPDGRWTNSKEYTTTQEGWTGFSSSPNKESRQTFATEREAFSAGVSDLKEYAPRFEKEKNRDYYFSVIDKIRFKRHTLTTDIDSSDNTDAK